MVGSCGSSGGDGFVPVMQTADLRDRDDPSCRDGLYRPTDRRVLAERQVRSGSFIVVEVGFEDSAQTVFIQHDHVIQTLPTIEPINRSTYALA